MTHGLVVAKRSALTLIFQLCRFNVESIKISSSPALNFSSRKSVQVYLANTVPALIENHFNYDQLI